MRITESQLRRIIREEIANKTPKNPDRWVVIGNYGRSGQTLYPSSLQPEAYSMEEAEDIADRLNSQERGFRLHWHAKPLAQADRYVLPGQEASIGLKNLRM